MRTTTATRGLRCFVAVLLPDDVRRRLAEAAQELAGATRRVAWVRAENLHLTLRFLGALEEDMVSTVREAVGEAARVTAPFAMAVAGLGGFPSTRAPRVVWAGVDEGAGPVAALHARLERALAARGVPPEGRPFRAHVTLGRARAARGEPALAPALAAAGRSQFGAIWVEAVHLMRSDLDPRGARHGVLARCGLTAADDVIAPRAV